MKCEEFFNLIKEAVKIKDDRGEFTRSPKELQELLGASKQSISNSRKVSKSYTHDKQAIILDIKRLVKEYENKM